MNRSSKKPLSDAMGRWKTLEKSNPILAGLAGKVYDNDIKSVKALLKNHPSLVLEPIDELGTTVLGLAVGKGFTGIVNYLLDNYTGHNFNQVCDKDGNDLVKVAIRNGYIGILQRLLEEKESGIDLDQPNKSDCTPLGVAIKKHQVETVKLLVLNKATIKIEDLFICCGKNYIDIASLLLNHMDMENKNEMITRKYKELSLLLFAVTLGNIEFTQFLISHGATDKRFLDACSNALTVAADRGDDAIVKSLIEAGADTNIEIGSTHKTPLMIAAGRGHINIAAMLIKNKQTAIAKTNIHGRNALYYAIRFWNPDIINLLLNVKDKDVDLFQGMYPMLRIYLFIQYYDDKTSADDRLLIKKLCNKCTGSGSERTIDDLVPELMKEEDQFIELLKFYITQQEGYGGAIELHTIKPRGKPLLFYAAHHGYKKIFTTLCQYANNIDEKDRSGTTALACAAFGGHFTIFNDLLKKGADFKAKDFSGRSILSYAIEGLNNRPDEIGSQCIVQRLLNLNVSVVELTDVEYMQLLDFVLQNKKRWNGFLSCIFLIDASIKSKTIHTY